MSSEWPLVAVEDVCELIVDCVNKTAPVVGEATPYRMIRTTNVRNGRIDLSDCRHVDQETYEKWTRRARLQSGDVILTREAPIGEVGIVNECEGVFLGQRLMQYRADPKHLDPRFLLYLFLSPALQHQFGSHEGSGSVVSHIRVGDCFKFKLRLPPLAIQKDIAALLGALDDRIALLRETNATLEAIAQALFKSWFVDFDPVHARARGEMPAGLAPDVAALFPDSLEESELGRVPKGWRVGVFSDACTRIESGGTPKRTVPEYWNGGVSWLTSGEVRNPIVFDTKESISDLGVRESSAKLWPHGTTVVAMYGATAGEVCLLASPTTANQACCGLIPKPQTRAFMFMCARRERVALASKSSGSAQQNLNKGLIEGHSLILPPNEVLNAYEESAGAVLDRWIANERQAQTLATLRDTLLPRLISGQLRLPEAEAQLNEAGLCQ